MASERFLPGAGQQGIRAPAAQEDAAGIRCGTGMG